MLKFLFLAVISCFAVSYAGDNIENNVDLPRFPSLSADGENICFSWHGHLWRAPAKGGTATRLTAHNGEDLRSAWSRAGEIAYSSTRNGHLNIHIMFADGTHGRQLTHTDRECVLTGFGLDANGLPVVTFSSTLECGPFDEQRPYMVPIQGGDVQRIHEAYGDWPVVSPNGRKVLFTRGTSSWLRRHSTNSDTRDIWMYDRDTKSFTRLTKRPGNDGQPRWIDDNEFLYLSDKDLNCMNLFRRRLDQDENSEVRLTSFSVDDIQSYDNNSGAAVLCVWDRLYRLDLTSANTVPQPLDLHASTDSEDNFRFNSIDRSVSEAVLSPDGKVLALVAYNEIYVRDLEPRSPAVRVTESPARKKNICWSPDGTKLYFVNDTGAQENICVATVNVTHTEIQESFDKATHPDTAKAPVAPRAINRWRDALRFDVKPLIQSEQSDSLPRPSRDGKSLAFKRGLGDLMVYDIATGKARLLRAGFDPRLHWNWSYDSRYIAFSQADLNGNHDVWIVPADGSRPPVNITRHPNNDLEPCWSADGRVLALLSGRVNAQLDVWMVNLDKDLDSLNAKELQDYYRQAASNLQKAKQPVPHDDPVWIFKNDKTTLDLDDAYLRLRRVSKTATDDTNLALTPAGDRVIYRNGDWLYSLRYDDTDLKQIVANAKLTDVSQSGDKIVFIEGGRVGMAPVMGGQIEYYDVFDRIRVDLREQSSQKFLEAARVLGERFYHPTMKGLDWKSLTQKYLELAKRATTASEFNDVSNRLLGELNASHMGIVAHEEPVAHAQSIGYLGVTLSRGTDGYAVTAIVPEGPADHGPEKLKIGDLITAVDFKTIAGTETIDECLEGRAGRETVITVKRNGAVLNAILTPITAAALTDSRYRAWHLHNASLVNEWSGGRIGYLHIRRMNESSMEDFERDLYAAGDGKEGLLLDVRNNGGGRIADLILASIMAAPHSYSIPRGGDSNQTSSYPRGYLFVQRYIQPINALCNSRSVSNAEIFSHAFQTLKRGTLVGEPTNGGVIGTLPYTLIDGTTVRIPTDGWFLLDGRDMENNPAIPDLLVPETPEAESIGYDEQLQAAVKDLLSRLHSTRKDPH